jgi:hypothetical protein
MLLQQFHKMTHEKYPQNWCGFATLPKSNIDWDSGGRVVVN